MITVTLPCDCGAEEHELEVEAEVAYPNRTGLYAPSEGDVLPCGRVLTDDDLVALVKILEDRNIRED